MSEHLYRTFVHGTLVQESALCAGGTVEGGPTDLVCARNGAGRLTIPGTGLAGALIETAGRIFPDLLRRDKGRKSESHERITGKADTPPKGLEGRECPFLQSVWYFYPCHIDEPRTESRQGVGIRQATGATAREKGALFDAETIPAGTRWDFLLEIDTFRGEKQAEAIALLALQEWKQGRCWLGGSAARGMGWMKLEDMDVVRLPLSSQAVDAWPDNTQPLEWDPPLKSYLISVGGDAAPAGDHDPWNEGILGKPSEDDRFWYLTLEATIECTPEEAVRNGAYGLDALSVGGHAAHTLAPLAENLLSPLGQANGKHEDLAAAQDAPVVTTLCASGQRPEQPFLPGSGLRGPLRHAVSRLRRGAGADVVDPNWLHDPARAAGPEENGGKKNFDPIARLFGLEELGARLLIRDARLADSTNFQLALFQHHAEDEFTAGVFGSSKFDRTAVIAGSFHVRLVIEAQSKDELQDHIRTLLPALQLAGLGHLPIGGAKWRGLGWVPWTFTEACVQRAGDAPETGEQEQEPERVLGFLASKAGQRTQHSEVRVQ